MLWDKKIF